MTTEQLKGATSVPQAGTASISPARLAEPSVSEPGAVFTPEEIREYGNLFLSAKEKIDQRGRTNRTIVLCIAGVAALAIIGYVIVNTLASPPWLQALALFLGTVPASVALWRVRVQFRAHMQKHAEAYTKLESAVDTYRSSSELIDDGAGNDD